MRTLVILGPGSEIADQTIKDALKEDITHNSYPKGEGIAVFDCGKEPDWSWADSTIVVGKCELGRHHADLVIGETDDATSRIIETLSVLAESNPAEQGGSAIAE